MKLSRLLLSLVVLVAIGVAGFLAYASRPVLPPVAVPDARAFEPAVVARGAQLAAVGDCNTCHTAADGKPFAGGRPLPTPFGTIYSTNLTPEAETGIGTWSLAAFQRAMREGVDREGHHLYPAFPYDHFTLATDADISAIYAFLMTRDAVRQQAPANQLPFPFNQRILLAGWNLLFLKPGPYTPDPGHDADWNRGAYLVEGLGHCGACHTPRNAFGAEDQARRYAGADIEGWHAYRLNASADAHVPWDESAIYAYLRNGWHGDHGVARGPMAPVVENLASVPDADVHAMARYVAFVMGVPVMGVPMNPAQPQPAPAAAAPAGVASTGSRPQSGGSQTVPSATTAQLAASGLGPAIYAASCAMCHESGRAVPIGGIDLKLSTALTGSSPDNLAKLVLFGVPAEGDGQRKPIMPGFAASLSDKQVVALAEYLRNRFGGGRPAWTDLPAAVARARSDARAEAMPQGQRSFASNTQP